MNALTWHGNADIRCETLSDPEIKLAMKPSGA
nr:hypothetical protein [Bradyrhizobium cosmicum]